MNIQFKDLKIDEPTISEIVFEKLDRFLIYSKLMPQTDFPKDLSYRRHYSAFRTCGKPCSYHKKLKKYLALTFANGVRIHIDFKWNIEKYIQQIVPEIYHDLIRNLLRKEKPSDYEEKRKLLLKLN
jgi:hypothetical protein